MINHFLWWQEVCACGRVDAIIKQGLFVQFFFPNWYHVCSSEPATVASVAQLRSPSKEQRQSSIPSGRPRPWTDNRDLKVLISMLLLKSNLSFCLVTSRAQQAYLQGNPLAIIINNWIGRYVLAYKTKCYYFHAEMVVLDGTSTARGEICFHHGIKIRSTRRRTWILSFNAHVFFS